MAFPLFMQKLNMGYTKYFNGTSVLVHFGKEKVARASPSHAMPIFYVPFTSI